jgi:hypothetical protein
LPDQHQTFDGLFLEGTLSGAALRWMTFPHLFYGAGDTTKGRETNQVRRLTHKERLRVLPLAET